MIHISVLTPNPYSEMLVKTLSLASRVFFLHITRGIDVCSSFIHHVLMVNGQVEIEFYTLIKMFKNSIAL